MKPAEGHCAFHRHGMNGSSESCRGLGGSPGEQLDTAIPAPRGGGKDTLPANCLLYWKEQWTGKSHLPGAERPTGTQHPERTHKAPPGSGEGRLLPDVPLSS